MAISHEKFRQNPVENFIMSLVQLISSKIRLKRRLTLTDVLPGIGETENLLKKLNITLTEKDIILKV